MRDQILAHAIEVSVVKVPHVAYCTAGCRMPDAQSFSRVLELPRVSEGIGCRLRHRIASDRRVVGGMWRTCACRSSGQNPFRELRARSAGDHDDELKRAGPIMAGAVE